MKMNLRLVLIFAASLILLGGCFQTRDPEPPGQGSNWTVPLEPEQLVGNFRTAVLELNQANYLRCFRDKVFRFEPDPDIKAQNSGIFGEGWSNEEERVYFSNVVASVRSQGGNQLDLDNEQIINYNPDSTEYIYDYQLELKHDKGTNTTYTGQLRFILVRIDEQEWRIARWEDLNNETTISASSWSDLKALFFGG